MIDTILIQIRADAPCNIHAQRQETQFLVTLYAQNQAELERAFRMLDSFKATAEREQGHPFQLQVFATAAENVLELARERGAEIIGDSL